MYIILASQLHNQLVLSAAVIYCQSCRTQWPRKDCSAFPPQSPIYGPKLLLRLERLLLCRPSGSFCFRKPLDGEMLQVWVHAFILSTKWWPILSKTEKDQTGVFKRTIGAATKPKASSPPSASLIPLPSCVPKACLTLFLFDGSCKRGDQWRYSRYLSARDKRMVIYRLLYQFICIIVFKLELILF